MVKIRKLTEKRCVVLNLIIETEIDNIVYDFYKISLAQRKIIKDYLTKKWSHCQHGYY